MEHLTDVKVTKVYEGPNGEGEWGKWQVYNFYLDKGEKKKFGWMQSGKKLIPTEGMELKHIGYEVEEDGGYTNYKIKEMELKQDDSRPSAISNAKEDMGPIPKAPINKDISFYVAYAKDIAVAMINGERFEGELLEQIVVSVAKAGKIMMEESMRPSSTPQVAKTAPESLQSEEGKSTYGGEMVKLRDGFEELGRRGAFEEGVAIHGAKFNVDLNCHEITSITDKAAQKAVYRDLKKDLEKIKP